MSDDELHWWDLEGDPVYCAVALVAAATEERAVELVVEYIRDGPDDPAARGWHNAASEEDNVPPLYMGNMPAPPGAEGVYFVAVRMPREWPDAELEALTQERERER